MSIVPLLRGKRRQFVLQSRSIEAGHSVQVDGMLDSIAVATYLVLKFCPRCGADLSAIVAVNKVEFDKLAGRAAEVLFAADGAILPEALQ